MKQTMKEIVWLVAFLAIGSIPVFGKPFATGPYLGQTQSCSAQGLRCDLWGENCPKLFLHITYFKLARRAHSCLNAFDEQKKA